MSLGARQAAGTVAQRWVAGRLLGLHDRRDKRRVTLFMDAGQRPSVRRLNLPCISVNQADCALLHFSAMACNRPKSHPKSGASANSATFAHCHYYKSRGPYQFAPACQKAGGARRFYFSTHRGRTNQVRSAPRARASEDVKEFRNELLTTETPRHRKLKRKGLFSVPRCLCGLCNRFFHTSLAGGGARRVPKHTSGTLPGGGRPSMLRGKASLAGRRGLDVSV